uniref:ATP synthase CF1 delta subunit n=1 Tax=Schizymenia dubyi TaxID=38368 RepID=A0A1C9C996_9FLOR|nr:ATP synthase CF1 delta subunit [Schizymenia dubyi]AOM64929.1 ATP synthase CF1 delta subunit [Schizymenia dubyi]
MSNQNVMSKVALPYAEALLELANNSHLLDKTNQDVALIIEILSKSIDLKLFLENPLITSTAKKDVLNQILVNQVNDFVLKFLLVLIDRRRIPILRVILNKYLELAYKLESIVIAEIATTVVLTESQEDNLIEKLKIITKSEQVKLSISVDSSLIAGFIIKIGSKVIDTSLSGKLKQMSLYLNAV